MTDGGPRGEWEGGAGQMGAGCRWPRVGPSRGPRLVARDCTCQRTVTQ